MVNRLKILLSITLFTLVFSIICSQKELSFREKLYCKLFISQRELNQAFLAAVFQNDLKKVKYYIDCGADVNAINIYTPEEWEKVAVGFLHDYPNYSALLLARSFPMVEYLLSKGANVNYIARYIFNNEPHQKNILDTLIPISIINNKPEIAIWILKAGAKPTKENIEGLERFSRDGFEDENQRRTAKAILRYINITKEAKLKRNKAQRQRIIAKESNLPKDLVHLIGGYDVVGEDEEKINQEPELVVHISEGV